MDDQKAIGKYEISNKVLGKGCFGTVYQGFSKTENLEVAIKHEGNHIKDPLLEKEFAMYRIIHEKKNPPVPKVYDFIETEFDGNYLVMESLGPNLGELFLLCGKKFSLKTTIWIAEKVLNILQAFHFKKYVYVDMKPENFVLGKGKNSNKLYIVDLGFVEKFTDSEGKQFTYSEGHGLRGTPLFASIWNHYGIKYGPRDDLIALSYILIRFLLGFLPWENENPLKNNDDILEMKLDEYRARFLYEYEEIPVELAIFLEYCYHLKYVDLPLYYYLEELLVGIKKKKKIIDDGELDWNTFLK